MSGYAVDVRRRVILGGRPQWIQALAERRGLPALLVLHGGPGFANGRAFLDRHAGLARDVTVVTWDQRGAGASFWGAGRERLTAQGLVADAAELVEFLWRATGGQAVWVLGLSWGSELGVLLVRDHPERVAGYIGSGQAVDGGRGEQLSWAWARERAVAAQARGQARARADIALLDLVGPPRRAQYRPTLLGLAIQRRVLGAHSGRMDEGDAAADALTPADALAPGAGPLDVDAGLVRRDWPVTLAERVGRPLGIVRSLGQLWPTATTYDFRTQAARLRVPVWFLQGRHDHTTPSELVQEYADVLDAPVHDAPGVRLEWFERSGHSPSHDEPDLFERRLVAAVRGDADE